MSSLTQGPIKAALTELIDTTPSEMGGKITYAYSLEEGDDTTVELEMMEGSDRLHVTWYVPLRLLEPDDPIQPDDFVSGSSDGYPVDNDWHRKSKAGVPPTPVAELGDPIEAAATTIQTAVRSSEYPISGDPDPYVMSVYTDIEDPYCEIPFIYQIE